MSLRELQANRVVDSVSTMHGTTQKTATFQSDGVEIFYRRFGLPGNTPIVIVHGLSYFSYDWIDIASALASDREIVAMDMRGFGNSTRAADYSLKAFASDIIALMDHLHWGRAILLGHSMGGRNCAFCAAENHDRIAGLILADWSPESAPAGSKRVTQTVASVPDSFESVDAAMRYFNIDPHSPQGMDKRARYEAYLMPVEGDRFSIRRDPHFREEFRRRLAGETPKAGVDLWAVLARIACPTLVIRGSRSDMFAAENGPRMKAANPGLELIEIDAGHHVAGDNPAAFLPAVKHFLDSNGGKK